MTRVRIRGDGVAACGCGRLLDRPEFLLMWESLDRPRVPAVMVGEATQKLLRDVFERADLFDGLTRVHKRVVAWGTAAAVEVPHSAIVVSEQALLDRLAGQLPTRNGWDGCAPEWTILAARQKAESRLDRHFGSRAGTAVGVKFRTGEDRHTCWVESLDGGWLFLLPGEGEHGWLLAVGEAPDALLGESRLVAGRIAQAGSGAASFPCYPRLTEPVAGPDWLACGTAALGFDPLCGDGTGYATREAILGAALIRASAAGADAETLAAHYRTRLMAGFQRHLEACRQFYETGGTGAWWRQETGLLMEGLDWCRRELAAAPAYRYRLNGFELEAVK